MLGGWVQADTRYLGHVSVWRPNTTDICEQEHTGTQFTCFTVTKVQILTPEELGPGIPRSISVYLLYWYKRTNTDAAGGRRPTGIPRSILMLRIVAQEVVMTWRRGLLSLRYADVC